MNYKTFVFFFLFLYFAIFHFPTFAHSASLLIDPSDTRTDDSFIMETTIRSYDESLVVRKPYDVTTLGRYDTIFIYSEQSFPLPEHLEQQFITYEGRLILIGKIPETKKIWSSFETDGTVEIFSLQGEPMQSGLSIERVVPNKYLQTIVEGERYGDCYPYIVSNGYDIYYVASTRVEGLKQYTFNRLLNNLYQNQSGHPAFIRLEGIDATSDVEQLEAITQYLKSQHVPILLSVKLEYTKTKNNAFKQNKKLLQLLQSLQQDGARIILNTSISNMDWAIRYLAHQKLYPFAIETEDLTFSYERYKQIQYNSNLYFGPLTSSHIGKVQHILPSTIDGLPNLTLYPETLGFVQQNETSIFRTWQHKLQLLTELPASVLSISYHPYLGVDPLKEVVQKMNQTSGIQWIQWDEYETTVQNETMEIAFSKDRTIQVTKTKPFYDQWLYLWENKTTETVLWILVGLVATFVTLFIFYVVRMRMRLRKRLFRERSS